LNFEKISDEILTIDDAMRYVRFINENGKLIFDKVKKDKTLLQDQEGLGKFSVELPIMKKVQTMFDGSLGKARFMYITRDNVHQFIYYIDSVIIYITCERNTDRYKILEILNKIDSILYNHSFT
jgi:hypothetical protein